MSTEEKLRHLDDDVRYTLPSSFTNFGKVCRARRLAETCLATAMYLQLNVPTEYIAFSFFSFMWKCCSDFNSL